MSNNCLYYGTGDNRRKVCGYYVVRLVPSSSLQSYADSASAERVALFLKITLQSNDGQSYSGQGQISWDNLSLAEQQAQGVVGPIVESSDFTQPNF